MERVYDIQQSDYENPTQSSISVHLSWSSSSFTAVPPDYADAVVVRIFFHSCWLKCMLGLWNFICAFVNRTVSFKVE
jgi:hypothetical protein